MPAPVPNVIGTPFEYPEGTTPPSSLAISCTPIASATYLWRLIERPDGSTAAITNATQATVTLTNFSTPGTYILFLVVTNDDGSSHPEPYPIQSALPPYGFSTPLQTAFAIVRVADAAGLYKPGRGEYGWFEKGLWPLFDKVASGVEFSFYDTPTRTLTANAIDPDLTVPPNDRIVAVAGLNVRNDTAAAEHELYSPAHDKINVLSNLAVTGKDLTVSGGVLKADNVRDASGGNLALEANASMTFIAGDSINFDADDVVVQVNGGIDLTAETIVALAAGSGDVQISAGDDITLTAQDDISLSAADDIAITASDDITINATGANGNLNLFAYGTGGDIWVQAGTEVKLETTRPLSSILLKPVVDTTTDKPLRAPGLALCRTVYAQSAVIFGPGPLFTSPPTYSRYELGSELDTHIMVVAYAPKDADIELVLTRDVGGDVTTLATLNSGVLDNAAYFLFNIRCRTKITKLGHIVTQLEHDHAGPLTSFDVPSTPSSPVRTYTLRNEDFNKKLVSFQVSTNIALAQYSAQMTCVLYNPHDQDVL